MADFSILQPLPNFSQAALAGYQAGTAIRKQKQMDSALQGLDLEKPETLLPVLRADPATGAALIGASTKLAAEKRDREARMATASYLKSLPQFGAPPTVGSGSVASGRWSGTGFGMSDTERAGNDMAGAGMIPAAHDTPTMPMSQQPPDQPSAVAEDGAIVVQGQQGPTPEELRNRAIEADPTGFMEIQKQIGQLSDAQIKRASAASDAFSNVGAALLNIPYAQRGAYLQANAADLVAHGVPPEKIANFDPTDSNIQMEVGKALGVKGMIDQRNKDREYSLSLDKFGEDQRHNRATEGNAAGNLAVAQGNLGLRAKELAQKVSSEGAGGGGSATINLPSPTTRTQYDALPKGTRYRAPDGSVRVK